MSTFTLTGNDLTHGSSVLPVYDSCFRFWRCQDDSGNDFNVLDSDGTAFVVSGEEEKIVSVTKFLLLLTSAERVAIKALRGTQPAVADFLDIIEDPRTIEVNLSLPTVREGIFGVLSAIPSVVTDVPARCAQIFAGEYHS